VTNKVRTEKLNAREWSGVLRGGIGRADNDAITGLPEPSRAEHPRSEIRAKAALERALVCTDDQPGQYQSVTGNGRPIDDKPGHSDRW